MNGAEFVFSAPLKFYNSKHVLWLILLQKTHWFVGIQRLVNFLFNDEVMILIMRGLN